MTTLIEMGTFLQNDGDWKRLSRLIADIGIELNERMDRFRKATIIEKGVEEYSRSDSILRVNKIGCDHKITHNINSISVVDTCEQKFKSNCLFYTNDKLKDSCSLKLTNSLGGKHTSLPSYFAEFLLVVEEHGAMLFHKSIFGMNTNLTFADDGITCKLNTSDGFLIAGPDIMDGNININNKISIKASLDAAENNYVCNLQ